NNKKEQANAYYYLAKAFHSQNNFNRARNYYFKALKLNEKLGNKKNVADIYNSIGLTFYLIGNYEKGIINFQKALKIEEEIGNKQGIANVLNNIGLVYDDLEDLEMALEYYQRSLFLEEELGNNKGIAGSLNNIGNIYSDFDINEKAVEYYERALKIYEEYNDKQGIAQTLNNIGINCIKSGEAGKALVYLKKSLKIEKEFNNSGRIANSYNSIGEAYFKLGDYQKANDFLIKSIQIAEPLSLPETLISNYKLCYKNNCSLGNYKKAIYYFEKYTQLKDSIFNKNVYKRIIEIQTKYETEKREKENEILRQNNKIQKLEIGRQRLVIYSIISIGLVILILVFLFYFRYRIKQKANKMLIEKNNQITKQKDLLEKTLQELKENEEKYRILVDNIQDGLFVIQDAKLIFVNDAFAQITGYTRDELLNAEFQKIIAPEDMEMVANNYYRRQKGEKTPTSYEFRLLHKDSKTRINVLMRVGLINYHGKIASLGTLKNITQQKKYEKELIESKLKADRSTALKSLFLANMSHEIRTHMSGIIGMSGILKETGLSDEQNEYLNIINISGNNLLSIINEILDFSKIEAGQIELENINIDIHAIIEEVIKLHRFRAKAKGISLSAKISPLIPQLLKGDPHRLKQIIMNLTNNAVKFTDKGSISIHVEVIKQHKSLYDKFAYDNGKKSKSIMLKFKIIDTGIGISEKGKKKLFKSFSQTDVSITRKQGGTGLGLSISKHLCELMNGNIGVESEQGKGATFWFTAVLQQLIEPKKEKITKSSGNNIENNKSFSVLIVEDNVLNQQLASAILSKEGHKYDVAENGEIGVEKFKKNYYDVVLMDIQMPVMDGIEATKIIRQIEKNKNDKAKKTRIIAVTAYVLEEEQQKLFDVGIDKYLYKPYKSAELINMINELCNSKIKNQ
ncbi:MAG: tetratricopeptide repeat protein, partial [Bacteroidales bacterium]|nr:tetratricopeptide repeat protein [Bacteroidales bacterium]